MTKNEKIWLISNQAPGLLDTNTRGAQLGQFLAQILKVFPLKTTTFLTHLSFNDKIEGPPIYLN